MVLQEKYRGIFQKLKKLWKGTFWSPSYFLATSGQVTLDVLKSYVDRQGVN